MGRREIRPTDIIDLHMHSTVSDGTDSPGEILEVARSHGFALFSLTDHDAVSGCADIIDKLKDSEEEPLFIPGVEFSCKDEKGKYHILGYGYEMKGGIMDVVKKGHSLRMQKLSQRLDYIKQEFGFDFSDEDIAALKSLQNPGKPHIANMMVRYGYVQNKEQAITEYLNKRKFGNEYVKPEEAIQGILSSGGIPVLAHPSYGSGDELILGDDMRERLEYLIDFGLEGVEAYYSGFTPRLEAEMLAYAHWYDLYVTAGSDYHGKNKLVPPGQNNLDSVKDGDGCLHKFLAAIADKTC